MAYACIASVNPHGRKKVRAPVERAVKCFDGFPLFATPDPRNFGRVIETRESLGESSERLTPSRSIMSPVATVSVPIANGESETNDPKSPRTPPKRANPTIRPIPK